MKGSIVKRLLADGRTPRFAAVVRIDGRQRWKWFEKEKAAQKYLAATIAAMDASTYQTIRPITFEAFTKTWIDGLSNVKPSTARAYRSTLRSTLIPAFGPLRLEGITPAVVNAFLQRQQVAGRAPKTSRNQLALLIKILGDAKEAGHLGANRLAGSKALQRPRAMRAEDEAVVEVFDPVEVNRLLDALDPIYLPLVLTWVSCGLRPGEVIGLQWGDIGWVAKEVSVRRTLWEGQDLVTKTKGSRRQVDVGDQLLAVLGGLRRERFPDGVVDPTAPLFLDAAGERIDLDKFRTTVWTPALARAGLAYRRPYSLRHTYATWQLADGQPISYVASQLGHASPVMLLSVYGRWLPKTRREAPARFEAALAAGRPVDLPAAVDDGPALTGR